MNKGWKAYRILVARRRFKSRLVLEAYDAWLASGQRGGLKGLDRRLEQVNRTYQEAHEANKRKA